MVQRRAEQKTARHAWVVHVVDEAGEDECELCLLPERLREAVRHLAQREDRPPHRRAVLVVVVRHLGSVGGLHVPQKAHEFGAVHVDGLAEGVQNHEADFHQRVRRRLKHLEHVEVPLVEVLGQPQELAPRVHRLMGRQDARRGLGQDQLSSRLRLLRRQLARRRRRQLGLLRRRARPPQAGLLLQRGRPDLGPGPGSGWPRVVRPANRTGRLTIGLT
mmetsp:Transcript_67222/g.152004  ORF Transcript_67222/g.152004 Transcript_67222/m.152004 type:complete len:218 (-) Transcript_67222:30-683(-)